MKAKLLRRQKSTSEIENRVEQEEESEYIVTQSCACYLRRLNPKPKTFIVIETYWEGKFFIGSFSFCGVIWVNFVHFLKQLIGYLHFCEASRMEFPPENMVGVLLKLKIFEIFYVNLSKKNLPTISSKLFKSNIDLRIPKLQHPRLKAPPDSAEFVKMKIPDRPLNGVKAFFLPATKSAFIFTKLAHAKN